MKKIVKLLLPLLGLSLQSLAQSDLIITPNRVVFEAGKQREEINLVNIGKDTANFSISFVQRNMREDGSFEIIDKPEPGQMFSDSYIRIYPRQVTLAPGEPQIIVLQYRRQAGMLAGEYRSHLYFRAEKAYKPDGMKKTDKDPMLLSVELTPIYGMTIPVIVRNGAGNVSTTLSDLKLDNQNEASPKLQLTINRTGNLSTYGDLIVEYNPSSGKSYQVARIKGVGVYTNINKRLISIPLNIHSGTPIKSGKLKVNYTNIENSLKTVDYAEVILNL
jgi:P pilus assembly chaperone PapD